MRHLDLFSGIGGFAIAAREVWGKEYENVGFCDNDHFCQQVLAKNFPTAQIYTDIRDVTYTDRPGRQRKGVLQQRGSGDKWSGRGVDLITGGFPCQPFSQAGKRRGTADNRHLWPQMLRVIQEFQPAWVIGENVGGLITWDNGVVFEQVCTDLEAADYEVQPFVIPAAAVNAPHRRDRVWIIACHAEYAGQYGAKDTEGGTEGGNRDTARTKEVCESQGADSIRHTAANLKSKSRGSSWDRDWRAIAAATCIRRMDDGLPKRMVRLPDGSTISEAKWRREAIKVYGNAIVPQVAMEIMKAIKEQV